MIPDSKLSPTQRMCLDMVRTIPGRPAGELAGGVRTVAALMRRWLVEVVEENGTWRVFPAHHDHRFVTTMHLDGCHWYMTTGRCGCGADYSARGERGIKADPYSAMWFELGDDGTEKCERCSELLHGARPCYDVIITHPPMVLVTADEPEPGVIA